MFSLWELWGCFLPKTLVKAFGLATLGSFLRVLQAGGMVCGDRVRSYSKLLKRPSGDEEGEEIHPGAQTRHFSYPSVSGSVLKPVPDVGAASLVSLGLPCCMHYR